jgi:hypothetical protein
MGKTFSRQEKPQPRLTRRRTLSATFPRTTDAFPRASRQHYRRLRPVPRAELLQDIPDMFFHGHDLHAERSRDLFVGNAPRQQSSHLFLTRREVALHLLVIHRATLAVPSFAAYLSLWLCSPRSGMGQEQRQSRRTRAAVNGRPAPNDRVARFPGGDSPAFPSGVLPGRTDPQPERKGERA